MFLYFLLASAALSAGIWLGRHTAHWRTEALMAPPERNELPGTPAMKKLRSADRDLWKRLDDAGIRAIRDDRDLREKDVGSVRLMQTPGFRMNCGHCNSEAMVRLGEVFLLPPAPIIGTPVACPSVITLGLVCVHCGWLLPQDGKTPPPVGRLAKLLPDQTNLFDVLDYLERVRNGEAEEASENEEPAIKRLSLPSLEQRRDRLEAALGETRTAIMRKKLEAGNEPGYRDADREP